MKVTNEIRSRVFKYAHKVWGGIKKDLKEAARAAKQGLTNFGACLKKAWAVVRQPEATKNDVTVICGIVKRETAAAYLISVAFDLVRSEEVTRDVWFPKSQTKVTDEQVYCRYDRMNKIEVAAWLAKNKLAEIKATYNYIADFS